ncbi:MAG: hypothetical protein QOJ80_5216 [Mycobacterium sp.]|nr:hypothetical protein [Mycobacterium sp.]
MASIHRGDVASADDRCRTIRKVIDRHGRLDIPVNNAGITCHKTVAKMAPEEWNRVIATKLSGAFFLAQAALAHMLERGSGRIVMASSVIGAMGAISQANYAASKSGLFGLTKTLPREACFQLTRSGKLSEDQERCFRSRRRRPLARSTPPAGTDPCWCWPTCRASMARRSHFAGSIQLEYGAEIGRATVNFDGPIVFCVISRYRGGAFVVFSNALNENMQVLAVEGSFSSVTGGAPAAAVVFTREVDARTEADPAVRDLEASTDDGASASLRVRLAATRAAVRSDKLGEVAAEFEAVHNIDRARRVGSVHAIIPAAELRPRIAEAVERGMARPIAAPAGSGKNLNRGAS